MIRFRAALAGFPLLLAISTGLSHRSANRLASDQKDFGQAVVYTTAALSALPRRIVSPRVSFEMSSSSTNEYDLEDVYRADFLGRQEVLVLGTTPSRLFAVSLTTGKVRQISRRGGGPGEFDQLSDFTISGDTMIIADMGALRVTALRGLGRIYWAARLAARATLSAIAGVATGGNVVLHSAGVDPIVFDSSGRGVASVILLSRSGDAKRIMELSNGRFYRRDTRFQGRVGQSSWRVGLSPAASVVAVGSSIVSTSGENYHLNIHGLDGRLRKTVGVRAPRRAVTGAMRAAAIEKDLEVVYRPKGEPMLDQGESVRLRRTRLYADSLPAIQSLILGKDGTIWVIDGIGPTDTGWTCTGFRADGSLVARLISDVPGLPLAIEGDRVLVRELDADGGVALRVRELARPRTR